MQSTPPVSPSTSPTPGSSKGKGIGKGVSNRTNQDQNTDVPPQEETIRESDTDSEPRDAFFDNKYAKYTLEEINFLEWSLSWIRESKEKVQGFHPSFFCSFQYGNCNQNDNLTNFYSTLEKTADAASVIYQHEVHSDKLHGLQNDHTEMLTQLHKYVNSLAKVKLNSTLNQRLTNQLVVDNQPHPVLAFKPKPLSKDSTPDEFAIWKDNFEVYFTASNAHNCDSVIQSVFLNTCIHEFLVSTLKKPHHRWHACFWNI